MNWSVKPKTQYLHCSSDVEPLMYISFKWHSSYFLPWRSFSMDLCDALWFFESLVFFSGLTFVALNNISICTSSGPPTCLSPVLDCARFFPFMGDPQNKNTFTHNQASQFAASGCLSLLGSTCISPMHTPACLHCWRGLYFMLSCLTATFPLDTGNLDLWPVLC